MIARLRGRLVEQAPTRIVVDVNGVGYDLSVPLSTFSDLPELGAEVVLLVHTWVSEGAIQLYGFVSSSERSAFELLLRASRVGPKLALSILSSLGPARLLEALRSGDVALLRSVPGVGSRLAERIILDLRDRTDALASELPGAVCREGAGSSDSARDQTLTALINLGYSLAEAQRVLAGAEADVGSEAGLETLIRASLRRLQR